LGVTRLRGQLRLYKRAAIDTSIFIYQLEPNPRYVALSNEVFSWLEIPGNSGVTSSLTLTELLVPAYRDRDARRLKRYQGLLTTFLNLEWVPPALEITDWAAKLRAQYGLKTPDAIQAATAVYSKMGLFLTNDPAFRQVKEINAILFDDLL
jgi:predicted nucleic acid-binding protein